MAVFLARMVMPRSFSMSFESMTRSMSPARSPKRAGLLQQLVHQRGFAVVNVGDDGDIADVLEGHDGTERLVKNWARSIP
jgi:hypothetical protein